jgi:hypothetical protein
MIRLTYLTKENQPREFTAESHKFSLAAAELVKTLAANCIDPDGRVFATIYHLYEMRHGDDVDHERHGGSSSIERQDDDDRTRGFIVQAQWDLPDLNTPEGIARKLAAALRTLANASTFDKSIDDVIVAALADYRARYEPDRS